MCGRYTLACDGATLVAEFGVEELASWSPRYNIAPTQIVPALTRDGGRFKGGLLHWGLVPSWAKDRKIGARLINARAETVAEKPSFRAAFRHRRCLVLADGYYEWSKLGGVKQPFRITRNDGKPFVFAGLWEHWTDTETSYDSCTIITCAANDDLASLHNRMPVVIEKADYAKWTDTAPEPATHLDLLRPAPNGAFTATAVSTFVNSSAHEGPDCIKPVSV